MHESVVLEAGIKKLLYVSSFDHMLGKKNEFVAVDIAKLCEQCVKRFEASTNGAARQETPSESAPQQDPQS